MLPQITERAGPGCAAFLPPPDASKASKKTMVSDERMPHHKPKACTPQGLQEPVSPAFPSSLILAAFPPALMCVSVFLAAFSFLLCFLLDWLQTWVHAHDQARKAGTQPGRAAADGKVDQGTSGHQQAIPWILRLCTSVTQVAMLLGHMVVGTSSSRESPLSGRISATW